MTFEQYPSGRRESERQPMRMGGFRDAGATADKSDGSSDESRAPFIWLGYLLFIALLFALIFFAGCQQRIIVEHQRSDPGARGEVLKYVSPSDYRYDR